MGDSVASKLLFCTFPVILSYRFGGLPTRHFCPTVPCAQMFPEYLCWLRRVISWRPPILVMCSFNPHLLPSDQLFRRSPMAGSCTHHVLEQTSSWGANETHALHFHRAYCGFPPRFRSWASSRPSSHWAVGSTRRTILLAVDYITMSGQRDVSTISLENLRSLAVFDRRGMFCPALAKLKKRLAAAAGRLFASCLHNSATSASFFSTASRHHL